MAGTTGLLKRFFRVSLWTKETLAPTISRRDTSLEKMCLKKSLYHLSFLHLEDHGFRTPKKKYECCRGHRSIRVSLSTQIQNIIRTAMSNETSPSVPQWKLLCFSYSFYGTILYNILSTLYQGLVCYEDFPWPSDGRAEGVVIGLDDRLDAMRCFFGRWQLI